jgi:hypothetical protein
MPTKPAPNPPPSKVNRHIFRFGQYKVVAALSRRATWVFQHPPRVTLLAHSHPSSPTSPGSTNLLRIFPFVSFSTAAMDALSGSQRPPSSEQALKAESGGDSALAGAKR